MNKSILVIDTPERCSTCEFLKENKEEYYCGRLNETDIVEDYMQSTPKGKPDWCPLKEIPQKVDEGNKYTDCEYYRAQGYNTCIDEILKGD